jgi:hypothetical protein
MWMLEEAEWWFNLWTVRSNVKKEEECGRMQSMVVQLVECEKE